MFIFVFNKLFVKILSLMQRVFQKNNDEELLTEIANTLSYFAHEEHTLADHAQRCAFDLASQLRCKFVDLTSVKVSIY